MHCNLCLGNGVKKSSQSHVVTFTLVATVFNVTLLRDILIYYVIFKLYDPRSKYSRVILFTDRQTEDTHTDSQEYPLVPMIYITRNSDN